MEEESFLILIEHIERGISRLLRLLTCRMYDNKADDISLQLSKICKKIDTHTVMLIDIKSKIKGDSSPSCVSLDNSEYFLDP